MLETMRISMSFLGDCSEICVLCQTKQLFFFTETFSTGKGLGLTSFIEDITHHIRCSLPCVSFLVKSVSTVNFKNAPQPEMCLVMERHNGIDYNLETCLKMPCTFFIQMLLFFFVCLSVLSKVTLTQPLPH